PNLSADHSLAPKEIANPAFAIDGIGNCLANLDVIKRCFSRVKSQKVYVRALELMYVHIRIRRKRFDRVRRETGWQWRDIDTTTLKLCLQGIRIANHARPQRRNLRSTLPII